MMQSTVPGSPRALALMRLLVFGVWLVKLIGDPLERLAVLPIGLFTPPGVLQLIPTAAWEWFLQPTPLLLFRIAAAALALLAFAGIAYRCSAVAAAVCMCLYQGVIRGFSGHVNHAELVLVYFTLILALSPAADAWALRRARVNRPDVSYALPLFLLRAVLLTTYLFAGAHRLVYAGTQLFLSNTLELQALAHAVSWEGSWDYGLLLQHSPLLGFVLRVGFPIVTILEILAPFALVSRWFRRLFLAVILPFHVANWLLLRVLFWENCFLLVVLLELEHWLPPEPPGEKR